MTMIEALLLLPAQGEPTLASEDVVATLQRSPTRFATCLAKTWFLTESGRRFLGQFRSATPIAVLTILRERWCRKCWADLLVWDRISRR